MSSQHTQPTIAPSGKPDIIEFYNGTKGGVDTFDQMCATSSCSRKTRRWPLCVWYGILNAACINAFIISCENCEKTGSSIPKRRAFMMDVGRELISPWAQSYPVNFTPWSQLFVTFHYLAPLLGYQVRHLLTASHPWYAVLNVLASPTGNPGIAATSVQNQSALGICTQSVVTACER